MMPDHDGLLSPVPNYQISDQMVSYMQKHHPPGWGGMENGWTFWHSGNEKLSAGEMAVHHFQWHSTGERFHILLHPEYGMCVSEVEKPCDQCGEFKCDCWHVLGETVGKPSQSRKQ